MVFEKIALVSLLIEALAFTVIVYMAGYADGKVAGRRGDDKD
jgi:hypothetical protein